jgi:restriction endonuclease S subunit
MYSKIDMGDRCDAEYFQKEFLAVEQRLNDNPTLPLSKVVKKVVASAFYPAATQLYAEGDTPFIRCVDCVTYPVISDLQEDIFERIPYNFAVESSGISFLKCRDIVVTKVGTPCFASLVSSYNEVALSRTVMGLSHIHGVLPEYLLIFLRCKYGFEQLFRSREQTIQFQLTVDRIRKINIYLPSEVFQKDIADLVNKYTTTLAQSAAAYAAASALLLRSLGMENFTPQSEAVTVKSFSESFGVSGRIDAEYYQPYYYEFESRIKQHGFVLADDICSEINYGTVPTSPYTEDGTGVPYIKGMNVKNTLISGTLDRITNIEDVSSKHYTQKGDIIISQMGTVADCGIVTEEQENWLFASFTIRLRLNKGSEFDPYFIGMYIQHLAKPYYFYRHIAQASVRQNTDLPTVKGLFIPKLPMKTQVAIAEQVQQSFALRRKSEQLLEQAKRAVEIAIENGEDNAMEMLNTAKIGGIAL